jgi:hypothetical protein
MQGAAGSEVNPADAAQAQQRVDASVEERGDTTQASFLPLSWVSDFGNFVYLKLYPMNKICSLCSNMQSPALFPKDIEGFENSYKVIESVYQRLLKKSSNRIHQLNTFCALRRCC